jgi:branched-subunit amino acid ABC-type transport system permease component
MGGAFAGVLLIPWFRDFFQLYLPPLIVLVQALGIAAVFVLLLELAVRHVERRLCYTTSHGRKRPGG